MKKKTLAIVLSAVMVAGLMAGCGGSSSSDTSSDSSAAEDTSTDDTSSDDASSDDTSTDDTSSDDASSDDASSDDTSDDAASNDTASGDFEAAELPEVPDLDGMTSNEWLISQSDQIPLSGVVANHYDSRADVDKGLDGVDCSDGNVDIAWLAASQGTQFFTTMVSAVEERCEDYGYTVTVYDANFDVNEQQEQYENVLTTDPDFIVCNAVDINATADLYRQSVDAGIPVIVTGPTAAQDDYNVLTTILASSWAAGFGDGEYCAELWWGQYPEAIKVGAVIDKLGDADSESRPNGFIAGYLYKYAELAGQPYDSEYDAGVIAYNTWCECRDSGSASIDGIIDMVGYVTTENIATSEAQPACAELLTAHPDMDVAFVETDSFGLAMVTECYQQGVKPGEDIQIVYGADGTGELCEAIQGGDVVCIGTNLPYNNAYGAIDLIHDIVEEGYDAQDLPANTFQPTYAVTIDNVDEVWEDGQPYASPLEDLEILTTEEYNEKNADD